MISIGSGLQTIGEDAFSDCNYITQISCEAVIPPVCEKGAFRSINKFKCKLLVPKEGLDYYKRLDPWRDFLYIEENTTGIQTMTSDQESHSDVYSLTGAKVMDKTSLQDVKSLPKGIYFIRGKKIIVK